MNPTSVQYDELVAELNHLYDLRGEANDQETYDNISLRINEVEEQLDELALLNVEEPYADEYDPFRDDVEADADVLASAGYGTDEDYGYFGGDEW